MALKTIEQREWWAGVSELSLIIQHINSASSILTVLWSMMWQRAVWQNNFRSVACILGLSWAVDWCHEKEPHLLARQFWWKITIVEYSHMCHFYESSPEMLAVQPELIRMHIHPHSERRFTWKPINWRAYSNTSKEVWVYLFHCTEHLLFLPFKQLFDSQIILWDCNLLYQSQAHVFLKWRRQLVNSQKARVTPARLSANLVLQTPSPTK